MWVYQYKDDKGKDHIKCFLCAHDVNKNFVDDIPFCPGIMYLACIDTTLTEQDGTNYVNFTVTRNISDFAKKESLLRSVLSLCTSSNSLEYVAAEWTVNHNKVDQAKNFPELKAIEFLVIDTDLNGVFDIEGRQAHHKLLCERHNLQDGRQYLVPRFAVIDTVDRSLQIAEITYLYHEDEENNILKTYCEIIEPRSQKKVSIMIDNPFRLEKQDAII